jgi:predicted double-glycine peptidase
MPSQPIKEDSPLVGDRLHKPYSSSRASERSWTLSMLALALLAACRPPNREPSAGDGSPGVSVREDVSIPAPNRLIPVPLVRQTTPFSCGDAAILAILRYYEPVRYDRIAESALYTPLHTTPEFGTEPQPMAAYLSHEPGLSAEVRWSTPDLGVDVVDLERAVDRGEPTIVAAQAWQSVAAASSLKPWETDWDDGHYLVVVGYDRANLYFMDPSTEDHYTYIPEAEFMHRWHDVLGARSVHTQHIAIFVHATVAPSGAASRTSGNVTFVR